MFSIKKNGKPLAAAAGKVKSVVFNANESYRKLLAFHQPIYEKRTRLLQSPDHLLALIEDGSARARVQARETLSQARTAMKIAP